MNTLLKIAGAIDMVLCVLHRPIANVPDDTLWGKVVIAGWASIVGFGLIAVIATPIALLVNA